MFQYMVNFIKYMYNLNIKIEYFRFILYHMYIICTYYNIHIHIYTYIQYLYFIYEYLFSVYCKLNNIINI
jgi:hypothetical protein